MDKNARNYIGFRWYNKCSNMKMLLSFFFNRPRTVVRGKVMFSELSVHLSTGGGGGGAWGRGRYLLSRSCLGEGCGVYPRQVTTSPYSSPPQPPARSGLGRDGTT